jgi:hypothetical protein
MHRESGVHTTRPWKRILPATLLLLAVGCGGGESQAPGAPESQTAETREPAQQPSEEAPGVALAPTPAQARPWFLRLGGPQDDTGTGLAVNGAGDIALVWLSTPREDEERESVPGQRRALTLARYTSDGQARWTREFPRFRIASPQVGASPRGEVFLSGNAFLHAVDFGLGAASDGFLVKFSDAGQPLWQRRVGQKVYGLVADGEGGVLVAAEEWTPEGHVPVLSHHDAQGAYRWTRQLDVVAEGTELHAVALAPSGRALLAGRLVGTLRVDGRTFGTRGGQGLVLLAFERDGRLAWGREVRGVDGYVTGLKPGLEGSVVLVGEFRGRLPWGGTTLSGPGAFVLAAGPEGAERWGHPLACGTRSAPPGVAVDEGGQVVAACDGVLSAYTPEGAQRDERRLSPGECPEGGCSVTSTALDFVPGQGLTLVGHQRHGGPQVGNAWNQDAFLRLLVP